MRCSLAASLVALLGTAPPAGAFDPLVPAGETVAISDDLTIEPIRRRAYRIVHLKPWAANSLLVEMADGTLVLCDTPYDDVATDQLLAWLRSRAPGRTLIAINGHFHADAMGGNGALHAAGIDTYGSDLSVQMLAERGPALHTQLLHHLRDQPELHARYQNVTWQPPRHPFAADQGLTLTFGDERVELFYPGPGHSPDNIVTWFPSLKLLFGGCLVRTKPRLPNVADADLERYPATVAALRRFDAEIIVPGHGPPGGPELLDVTLAAVAAHTAQP